MSTFKFSLNSVLNLFLLICSLKLFSAENNTDFSSKLVSKANNYFALNLLKQLCNTDENVVISPFSLTTVFNMLYFGAKERTAEEISDVFGLRLVNLTKEQIGIQTKQILSDLFDNNSSSIDMFAANGLFAQNRNPVLKEYEQQLSDYFNTSIQTVDFLFKSDEAVQQINNWVSKSTGGKVYKLLVQPMSPLNVLVLLNAVYFKGRWSQQFLKWATKEEDFHSLNKVVKVSQMKLTSPFNYTTVPQLNDSQLIELSYVNGSDISMFVLLPSKSAQIQTICNQLNTDLLDEAINNLTVTTVKLILPRFNITGSYQLKTILKNMGIQQSFTYKSDLSGIDGTNYLHISDVYHKTVIEVSEEGSETTGPKMTQTRGLFGIYRNVQVFRADHPFLFFIRQKTSGVMLFSGIFNKP